MVGGCEAFFTATIVGVALGLAPSPGDPSLAKLTQRG